MGIFNNVLLVSDFDGTLTGADGRIPFRNIEKIQYFIEQGGCFSISTGRTMVGFHNYSADIINAPVLLGNGAMAYDYSNRKTIFVNAIEATEISVLLRVMERFPDIGTEIYSVDGRVSVLKPNRANYKHFEALKIYEFNEISELSDEIFPVVKIMISAADKSRELQAFMQSIDLGKLKYIPTLGDFVEILSEEAGKGRALYQLADSLKIDCKRVFAVGDGSNDVDMLTAVMSFSPSNGEDAAKAAADIIVCASDKGSIADVVDFLENKIKTENRFEHG